MISQNNKPVLIWLFTGCFLVFAMVIIGGITRLTHSGLSITEWNVIMGSIPPLNEQDWNIVFEKYKQFPEYQLINYDMSLHEFKGIFWWEFSHRLIGRLIGIVFLVPFIYFLVQGKIKKPFTYKLLGVFLLGGLQGFIGWYMVASGLIDNPHVSHYRLATHLITAFLTFGYIFWLALDLIYIDKPDERALPKLRAVSRFFLLIIIAQIIYGAFVAGLKAGLIYNTFPKMGDSWVPEAVTAIDPFYLNFLQNMAGVQFAHRIIATIILITGITMFFMFRKSGNKNLKKAINVILSIILIQFTLGVLTLLYAVPLSLGVLHQLGAFFLFASSIFLVHRTKKSTQMSS
jgi:heme a synthase